MRNWLRDNQFFILFLIVAAFVTIGYMGKLNVQKLEAQRIPGGPIDELQNGRATVYHRQYSRAAGSAADCYIVISNSYSTPAMAISCVK